MTCVIPLLLSSLVEFVNPFIGTAGRGHCYPGAAYPFGLVQASPDSGERGCARCSGYAYEDKVINMFSQTHNPGGGCPDYADIGLMPYVGECDDPTSPFDRSTERAAPGYYAVTLSRWKARVEMTATEHCGFYRIVFGGDAEEVNLLCDPDHGMGSSGEWAKKRIELVDLDRSGAAELKGKIIRSGFVPGRPIGFTYRFSLPPVAVREIPAKVEAGVPHAPSFVYSFRLGKTRELLVKVGLSTRSMDGAARNADAELPDWDFDRVRRACAEKWERILGRVELDADTPRDQKVQFYTAVYRMMAQPTNIADADEEPYYSEFAFWDTFRATHPFYTMFAAEYVPAFINSMIGHRRRFGYLPVLAKWGRETHCMIATHGVAVMADACLKGFTGVDWEAAWEAIEETLRHSHPDRKKEGWEILDKYGYYPCDLLVGEGVSRTLECSYDDWCAWKMAERLGKSESAAFFRKRSENWRNVLDPSTGHMRGRKADGSWRDPFDPYLCGHENDWPADFTEGSAMQYRWHVLQDPAALVEALGGKAKACTLLDELFADNHAGNQDRVKQDVCGLWGQYVHGNEPSHHIAYLYQYADRPDRTAERIRGILDRFYRNAPDGLCGNEDHGQMSAWYVFACLGFYPVNPASGEFVLGAPQIPGVSLRLSNGKTFRMTAKNFGRENLYVKSALLNGRPIGDFVLRYDDIMKGGELVFEMSDSQVRAPLGESACATDAALMAPAFEADLSVATSNVSVVNYQGRTPVTFGTEGGRSCVTFAGSGDGKSSDTLWGVKTRPFAVTGGREYLVLVEMSGVIPVGATIPGVRLVWKSADGRELETQNAVGKTEALADRIRLPVRRNDGGAVRAFTRGKVPGTAAWAYLDVVVDWPNLKDGETVSVRRLAYFETPAGEPIDLGDLEAPVLEVLNESPSADFTASLRFRLRDASGINWDETSFRIDGVPVALEELKRSDDVFVFEPTNRWEEDSIHRVEVSGADLKGNTGMDCGFVAFTRKKPAHPRCAVRDDGMVLREGKPFFPLGWFRVRPCEGNGYDLDGCIADMKANGMNFAHTYMVHGLGSSREQELFDELVLACERHGVMLYTEPADRKPHGSRFLPLMRENLFRGLGYRTALFWGIGDDTSWNLTPDDLKYIHRCCKAVDPDALTISADVAKGFALQVPYVPYFDLLFIESYPIREEAPQDDEMAKSAACVDDAWAALRAGGVPGRSVVAIPQAFRGWRQWKRMPTSDEVRCQAYLSIACGARGLVYYASTGQVHNAPSAEERAKQPNFGPLDVPERKESFFALMRELSALEPSLVLRDARRQPTVTVLKGPERNVLGGASVRCLLKEDGLLVVANSAHAPVTVEIRLPSGAVLTRGLERNGAFSEKTYE